MTDTNSPAQPARTVAERHKLKVLFIIDQLCEIGGAERVLFNIVRDLPKDRFACEIATLRADPAIDEANLPCPLHVFPLGRTWGWSGWKTCLALRRLIRFTKFDIVHTFFETSDLWAGPIAKLSGCSVLVSSRRDMGVLRSAKHRLAYRMLGGMWNEVQTVSNQVRQFCIEQDKLDQRKVTTLYNGVALHRADQAKARDIQNLMQVYKATHAICTVANIRRIKGLDVFVRAAAIVCQEFPNAVFLIIGKNLDPVHATELEATIQRLGLRQNVIFLGSREDIFSVLKACDVFCLLSRSEGLSNAVLEAMACELPCVVSGVGGNPELVRNGRNGYVVPSEDAADAARKILELLRNPERARAMGSEGRKIINEQFRIEIMIEKLVESYESLVAMNRAR